MSKIEGEKIAENNVTYAAKAVGRRFRAYITESRIWKAVRTKFCVLKAGDLL